MIVETWNNGELISVEEVADSVGMVSTVEDVRQVVAATDLAPAVKDALAAVLDAVEASG